jgi:hypothetical protein
MPSAASRCVPYSTASCRTAAIFGFRPVRHARRTSSSMSTAPDSPSRWIPASTTPWIGRRNGSMRMISVPVAAREASRRS